jgi:hypothetical protein
VALDLVDSSRRRRGLLLVHRIYSQRDLQLDINLLTSAFPVALADALDRSLQPGLEVIPQVEQHNHQLIEAQAG